MSYKISMAIVIFNRKVVNQSLRKYTRILYMKEVKFLKFVTVVC